MGKLLKKTVKKSLRIVGIGGKKKAAPLDPLAEREATTPVMPDDEALKRAARRRLAGSVGRSGRASTFLSDPSEGL
ncbi:MAG: hypothetical protein AB7F22_17700 [Reyranella sp.]|uniref:hypothetical protein n=1 Tax=Reyranella sp. TaxID=1929291 RepID=UPI003D0A4715